MLTRNSLEFQAEKLTIWTIWLKILKKKSFIFDFLNILCSFLSVWLFLLIKS